MFPLAAIEATHVVIGIVALILILFAAYYITRMMKGKVSIELPKRGYNSGETITGKVTLMTRKKVDMNRFYVSLIGYQIVESRDSDGDRKTRKNEVYRNELNLAEQETLRAGTTRSYDFNLVAPGNQTPGEGSQIPGQISATLNGAANVIGALGGMGSTTRRLEWKLEARADLPGVDLASSRKLRVNLI